MSQQQQDPRHAAILAHLDKWWKNRTCRICGTLPTWESDLYPYTMPEYVVLSQPTKALAVIHLLCSGCGHLEMFGAAKVGAMQGLPSITVTPAEVADTSQSVGTDANGSPVEEA